jgi:aryl-alcohol dehydrogenase-like predicted oxidoreductase
MRRLKTDYIDVYQLHNPALKDLTDDLLSTLTDLKRSGKIGAIGVSLRSPVDGQGILERYSFDAVQVNFNMIDQRLLEVKLSVLARQKGFGIIARTPLNFGFLASSLSNIVFGENDHRRNWPKEQLELWSNSSNLFESLCQQRKISKAQLALQFCLAFDEVSTAIPGMLNTGEVLENAAASELEPLTAEELQLIQRIYQTHAFVVKEVKHREVGRRYSEKIPVPKF